jgi:fructuronate reductase
MLHLGLGSFFRAHQAWYTARAGDAAAWGIAAFGGRSARLADLLAEQEGAYTLVTRGVGEPGVEHVGSITRTHGGSDHAGWLSTWADPGVRLATLTVTEAAYARQVDGSLDLDDPAVEDDLTALRQSLRAPVTTVPARLVAGLAARREAGAGPLSVVPCDNLPGNGVAVRRVALELAESVDPELSRWAADQVQFVSSMVDRITPATTQDDIRDVTTSTGLVDLCPVVTEPFSEWYLAGEFVGGRPEWESSGAVPVADVAPYERRKLWLLNGAHSLMAYAGAVRGHETVADAVADPPLRGWVEAWWDEAERHLQLPTEDTAAYRAALLGRFANPGLRHLLAQIALDGRAKLPVRLGPVLRAERAAGRLPRAGLRTLAAWTHHLALEQPGTDPDTHIDFALRTVVPELAHDVVVRRTVAELREELSR